MGVTFRSPLPLPSLMMTSSYPSSTQRGTTGDSKKEQWFLQIQLLITSNSAPEILLAKTPRGVSTASWKKKLKGHLLVLSIRQKGTWLKDMLKKAIVHREGAMN